MAKAKAKKKSKWSASNPSPKQLAARRKFARMSKLRAKAARAKNRKTNARKAATRKPAKRPATKRNVKKTTKRAVARKSSKRVNKRRNSEASDVQQLYESFSGRPQDSVVDVVTPAGTPKHVGLAGDLLKLKAEKLTIDYNEPTDGEVLVYDRNQNLYVGNMSNEFEPNQNFGHLEVVHYGAVKQHISPEYIEYYHHFGEEGGNMPTLRTDSEGNLIISGGDYGVESDGIINGRKRRNRGKLVAGRLSNPAYIWIVNGGRRRRAISLRK